MTAHDSTPSAIASSNVASTSLWERTRSDPDMRLKAMRALSGSVLIVSLGFAFVERLRAPDVITSSQSPYLPAWVGWAAVVSSVAAAVVYNVADYVDWLSQRAPR